ncbi:MAG: ubiquinone biosynthesis protein COQ4 [Pseudomonadales bacterium]|nr:ubiquinone biosynthesis protein COQ4 [Pseudomonadales bacterium]
MNIETNNTEGSNVDSRSTKTKAPRNNRMRPLVAMRALKNLVNDPEKTDQVFVVIKAMSGNSLEKTFVRFSKTETGRKILSENRNLLTTLLDRDSLQTHDAGTLAHAYLGFVEREQISADGLVEASQLEDKIEEPTFRLFGERMRDQHDLWHVTTGYGRDTFGEACLLAFTYAQTRNRGLGIITLVGMIKLQKELGSGVRKAIWQAYKAGKRAAWLPQQDWETLLSQPLDEVRQQLRIAPPEVYQEVFENYKAANA